MYIDPDHQYLHQQQGSVFLVLKFNTKIRLADPKYNSDRNGIQSFAEDVRSHLTAHQLIRNCESMLATINRDQKQMMKHRPLPLYFDKTFIFTTLTQIMKALSHAHGLPVYHDDLKPDNIMFKTRIHAHCTQASMICAKVIDWGCSGFSKDTDGDATHVYKPHGEPPGPKCDMYSVGQVIRFLYDGSDASQKRRFQGVFAQQLNSQWFNCTWNTNPAFQLLDPSLCIPWNPNTDAGFIDLVKGMTDPNPYSRFSAIEVLRHPWMASERADQPTEYSDELNQKFVKKLNDLLYHLVAPSYLKRFHDRDDLQNEETKFLDLMKDLPTLRRSLDVLVMLSMLEQAPYARGFISSNLIAYLSKFVHDYMFKEDYPERHLPRTMKLLAQLASHQSNEFLEPIVAARYQEKARQGRDSDGRTLIELIAYGVFDCHDPDVNHSACSLYTMMMLIAMSSTSCEDAST
jgi:serine/threonine protein kinase